MWPYDKEKYSIPIACAIRVRRLFADQKDNPDVPVHTFTSKPSQVSPAAFPERFRIEIRIQENCVNFFPDLFFKTTEMSESIDEIIGKEPFISLCHLKASS